MKFTLGTVSYKLFQKIVRLLAKTSDDININAQKDKLVLKSINMTETAYCICTLSKSFFLEYRVTTDKSDKENDEANKCILSARPLVFAFKSAKNVISSTITIEDERLVIITRKKRGALTRNSLHINEYENIQELNEPANPTTIEGHCSLFSQVLKNFPKKLNDLSVALFPDRIELSNHIAHPEKDVETVRMNLQICANELTKYEISDEHRVIISTENFLAYLMTGQHFSDEMTLSLTRNGRPVFARTVSKDKMIDIQMILSSIREETLRKNRKEPVNQSYRDLVLTFMENREKMRQRFNNSDNPRSDLSDTEMNRVCSPAIESATVSGNASIGPINKSSRLGDPCHRPSFARGEVALSNNKKAKVTGNYTQEDLNSVSKILDDLENFDPDDDDAMTGNQAQKKGEKEDLGCMENFIKPPWRIEVSDDHELTYVELTTSSDVDSAKSASVQRAAGTSNQPPGANSSHNIITTEDNNDVPMPSVERTSSNRTDSRPKDDDEPTPRFQLGRMNFPSEEIVVEKSPARKPPAASGRRRKIPDFARLDKLKRREEKKVVGNVFGSTQSSNGVIIIPDSDPESE